MHILVENTNTAQLTAGPFSFIFLKIGIHGLKERSHEWDLPRRPNDAMFLVFIRNC